MSFDEQPDPLSDCMENYDKLKAERDALLAVIGEMREVFSCVEVHEDMIGVRDQSGTSFWVNTPKPKGWHAPLIPFLEKIRGLMQSKPTEALARLKDEVAAKVLDGALEAIAAECHRQWSGWVEYMFTRMVPTPEGYNLGRDWRDRWQRQCNTPYAELSELEKESDRREARKILAALRARAEGR